MATPQQVYVLIVEDDDRISRLYQKTLRHAGYNVRNEDSVEAALQALFTFDPDVICLDWRLVDGNAAPILEALKQEDAQSWPAILLISGQFEHIDISEYRELIVEAVPKPFSINELKTKVKKHAAEKIDRLSLCKVSSEQPAPGVLLLSWQGTITAHHLQRALADAPSDTHALFLDISNYVFSRNRPIQFPAGVGETLPTLKSIYVIHPPEAETAAKFLMKDMPTGPQVHYCHSVEEAVAQTGAS
jgi:DNA-binding response OmpR family regulator